MRELRTLCLCVCVCLRESERGNIKNRKEGEHYWSPAARGRTGRTGSGSRTIFGPLSHFCSGCDGFLFPPVFFRNYVFVAKVSFERRFFTFVNVAHVAHVAHVTEVGHLQAHVGHGWETAKDLQGAAGTGSSLNAASG